MPRRKKRKAPRRAPQAATSPTPPAPPPRFNWLEYGRNFHADRSEQGAAPPEAETPSKPPASAPSPPKKYRRGKYHTPAAKHIEKAVQARFPEGHDGVPPAEIVRAVLEFLSKPGQLEPGQPAPDRSTILRWLMQHRK
jgi:hypothetical protein